MGGNALKTLGIAKYFDAHTGKGNIIPSMCQRQKASEPMIVGLRYAWKALMATELKSIPDIMIRMSREVGPAV